MLTPGRLGVLISCFVLASFSAMAQPPAESAPASNPAPSATSLGPNALPQAVDMRTYEIGAQDILRIEVYQDPNLTRQVVVLPDGRFSLPLIGAVQANGLTPERLEAQLEQALMEFVQSPDVTVSVMQVNSKVFQVTGWVNSPGTFPLVKPTTVYDAIIAARGFREYADEKHVIVMRGATERIEFNAKDYVKGKNPEKNIQIQNGDIVLVKED